MGVDLARLTVDVDASQVTPAATKLDTLTAAGARAEAQTGKLKTATATLTQEQIALGDKTLSASAASDVLAKRADKLLSQMDPMYKAQKAYAAQLAEIKLLNEAGAISESERAAVTIAAEKAMADATAKSAAVQVASHEAVAGSSIKLRETLVELRELSVGNYTRAAGSATILLQAFGLLNSVLVPALVIGAAIGATFLVATQQINKGSGDLTKGLGLTADQLERVKQKTVTFGDTVKATFQVIGKDIGDEFSGTIAFFGSVWQAIVDGAKTAVAFVVGSFVGAARSIEEAWKSLPTFLGGEGKAFSFADIGKAFLTGMDDAKKSLDKFYSDVADQARKNRVGEILKEAGKPKRDPGQGQVDRAARQLTETQNQLQSQTALNKAVEDGTLSMAEANEQTKIDGQLKTIIAERDNASGALKQKLTDIINKLIPATKALNEAQAEFRILQDNDRQQKANELLEKEISLAGKSNEERAVAIAQFKVLQDVQSRHVDPNSAAGKKALQLAGDGASLGLTNQLVNSVANDNGNKGEQIGKNAASTVLGNDPASALAQQKAAYAAIDKLRKADVLSEQQAAQAKGLADQEYNSSRLSFASNMFGQLATLSSSKNKELAAIGKAAAIVQAEIDGVLAVQKALSAYPPPYSFIAAGVVGVAAAANVAMIMGYKEGGYISGPGGPKDDKVLMWGSNGEFMVNAAATAKNRPLLEAINGGADVHGGSIPMRANGGYIGPVGPANSNNAPHIEINNYGTSKGFEVQHVSDDHIRIIARDEDHKNTPEIMARETANRNSKFRRTLGQHTRTQNRMSA